MAFDIQNQVLKKYTEELGITEVIIPDGVTKIGDASFCQCRKIQKVILPDSVTAIGKCAFWNCYDLESIYIPDSVISIGARAFQCCYSLSEMTIPESVKEIGSVAFGDQTDAIKLTFLRNHRKMKITLKNPWNLYAPEEHLADFIAKPCFKNFSLLKPEFKIPFSVGWYNTDKQISAYLKRIIKKAVIFAIDRDDTEMLSDLLDTGFITKKNIDFLIQYAIEDMQKFGNPEFQVMLTDYKYQHFPSDISDISRKLKL